MTFWGTSWSRISRVDFGYLKKAEWVETDGIDEESEEEGIPRMSSATRGAISTPGMMADRLITEQAGGKCELRECENGLINTTKGLGV